jgi:hypothetical protein
MLKNLAAGALVVLTVALVGLWEHLFEIALLLVVADWYWKKKGAI